MIDLQIPLKEERPMAQGQANLAEPVGIICLKICSKAEPEKLRLNGKNQDLKMSQD